ncbi:MAG: hypothetical protein AAGF12_02910 [Myxococcota bacterium]
MPNNRALLRSCTLITVLLGGCVTESVIGMQTDAGDAMSPDADGDATTDGSLDSDVTDAVPDGAGDATTDAVPDADGG